VPTDLPRATGFLLGFWLALTLLGPLASSSAAVGPGELMRLEADLHEGVNATRSQHGRITLERRADLDAVARAHSADMAARRYLAHDTPEGLNPVDRLSQGGISGFSLAGENVGQTNRSNPVGEIQQGWLFSPVHRENLLAPAFNATGIGVAGAADGTLYFTQLYVTFPR
jgi:uncharacterized protein YkwD